MTALHAFWNDIWPNLAASAIWAPGAFVWHHRRITRHMTAIKGLINDQGDTDNAEATGA
jgi:hypothetical protein